MFTLKRIGIASAFRVGLVVGAIIAAIVGLFVIALQSLFISALTSFVTYSTAGGVSGLNTASDPSGFLAAFSLATACIFYIMNIIFSAVFGGLFGAAGAFAYNVASRWVGGVEFEMSGSLEKAKRSMEEDLFD